MFSLLASLTSNVFAQYDTLHYIPPVFVADAIKNSNNSCRDHYLVLSTNETVSFQVTVVRGDGSPFTSYAIIDGSQASPGVFNLSRTNPIKIKFSGTGIAVEHIFTESDVNTPLNIGGYKLTGPKRFFANIRHSSSAQGASLTSKGTTALGVSFLAGFQAAGTGTSSVDNEHSNFIAVMATSDNTNVTVNNFNPGVTFLGQPSSGTPATANTITFTLNEGQSYIIAQIKSNMSTDMNAYNGIRITSNKDIAVNSGAWTGPSNSGASRDIGIDQIIPAKYAGIKYGITSGKAAVNGSSPVEKVIVIATKTGTTTINSGAGGTTTLTGQGSYAILTGNSYWAAASPVYAGTEPHYNMALTSDQPILVYQTLFGNSNVTTSSMNVIPPLADCIGSDSIYIHDPEQFGNSSIISITSPVTATVKVENHLGATLLTINPSAENLPGTLITDFKTTVFDIPNSANGILVTANEKVTVGFLGASSNVGGGGFMSAFSDRKVTYNSNLALFIGNGETKLDLCEENPTFLSIEDNGVYSNFQWYKNEVLMPGETNDTLSVFTEGFYYVVADYCSLPLETQTLTVGEFGSPGGQSFKHIAGLYEVETFQGFTNNSPVGAWDDESKAFNNALSLTNAPSIKTGLSEKPGYHPTAFFDETNQEYLKSLDNLSVLNGSNKYSFFAVLKDIATPTSNEVITFGNTASSPKLSKVAAGYRFSQVSGSNGNLLAEVATSTSEYTVVSIVSDGSTLEIFANGRKGSVTGSGVNALDIAGRLIIGGSQETGSTYFDGGIAELVLFDTTMPPVNRQKIESYYAMKFGITLDPINDDAGIDDGDYVSSAGTVVWDFSANTAYHNSISSLGYDACGRLRQNQNRDANENDFINIGLDTVVNTNGNNGNTLTNDDSFFICGHDDAPYDSYGVTDYGITLNPETIQARVARVWKAQETGTVGTVMIQFNLLGGTSTSIYNLADTRLLVDTDATFATGATSYAPSSFNNVTGMVSFKHDFNAGTGFYFTLGSVNNITTPLPITLVDFKAQVIGDDKVECTWETASELNNDYFTLESSQNGIEWRKIAEVKGVGNSSSLVEYDKIDEKPYTGLSYYRLSQTDFDGKTEQLGIRSVLIKKTKGPDIGVFPNPAGANFMVYSTENRSGEIIIRSSVGKTVQQITWVDQQQMTIDASGFANGIYIVECIFDNQREVIKVVVRK